MTEIRRNRSGRGKPLPVGPYVTLTIAVLAALVVVAALGGSARARDSQPQYRGFNAAGAGAVNYAQTKQRLMSALGSCLGTQPHPEFIPPKVIKSPENPGGFYPTDARRRGEQAVLFVAFLDDTLGNTRFLHVGEAFPPRPDSVLVEAAMRLVRGFALTPASRNGQPVSFWTAMPVKFILQGTGGPMGSLLRQDAWLAMLDKANAGDSLSIADSAYVAGLVGGETGLSPQGRWSLLVDSALQGADFARMQLYRTLSSCSQESVVEPWVAADARGDNPEAKMRWAQIIWAKTLASGSEASQTEQVSQLLHSVAAGADPFYQLWAAGVLAIEPGLRDPATALRVAVTLNARPDAGHEDDPDYGELLAAAQAASGQFPAAVQSELKAIRWARRDGWNPKLMESRLATYQAGRPWFGHLCDCQQLAPDDDVGVR